MAQQQVQKTRQTSVKRIDEAVRQYEADQHADTVRKARRAVRRAHNLVSEAEDFLATLDGK